LISQSFKLRYLIILFLTVIIITSVIHVYVPGTLCLLASISLSTLCIATLIYVNLTAKEKIRETAQAQKLQTLGQLSGAIAHDFNNILTAVIGYSDILISNEPQIGKSEELYHIKSNALRGAKLIKQLLSHVKEPSDSQEVAISIKSFFSDLEPYFSQLLGAKHKLTIKHNDKSAIVVADPIQLERVVTNLITNAKDAMPNGGEININTSLENISNTLTKSDYINAIDQDLPQGEFVQILISDHGHGISKSVIKKVFDPFFSTKRNTGTGLGLATVAQIMKDLGGHIFVKSKENVGTSFLLLLTHSPEKHKYTNIDKTKPSEMTEDFNCNDYHILFVEDEDPVRLFSSHVLKNDGFNVIDVRTVEEALDVVKQGIKIDLLITDITLGSMDGNQLALEIKKILPNVALIITSGYDKSSVNDTEIGKYQFISKPYTTTELTNGVIKGIKDNEHK
jgi:two-component system cell cycle sensor histidine kinase/response regulator CckA